MMANKTMLDVGFWMADLRAGAALDALAANSTFKI